MIRLCGCGVKLALLCRIGCRESVAVVRNCKVTRFNESVDCPRIGCFAGPRIERVAAHVGLARDGLPRIMNLGKGCRVAIAPHNGTEKGKVSRVAVAILRKVSRLRRYGCRVPSRRFIGDFGCRIGCGGNRGGVGCGFGCEGRGFGCFGCGCFGCAGGFDFRLHGGFPYKPRKGGELPGAGLRPGESYIGARHGGGKSESARKDKKVRCPADPRKMPRRGASPVCARAGAEKGARALGGALRGAQGQ